MFGASDYWAQFRVGEYLKSLLFLKQPAIPEVFEGSHYAAVNGSMWSISYEFKCYVIALIFGLLGFLKKRVCGWRWPFFTQSFTSSTVRAGPACRLI